MVSVDDNGSEEYRRNREPCTEKGRFGEFSQKQPVPQIHQCSLCTHFLEFRRPPPHVDLGFRRLEDSAREASGLCKDCTKTTLEYLI
jgi:hypothetical protein